MIETASIRYRPKRSRPSELRSRRKDRGALQDRAHAQRHPRRPHGRAHAAQAQRHRVDIQQRVRDPADEIQPRRAVQMARVQPGHGPQHDGGDEQRQVLDPVLVCRLGPLEAREHVCSEVAMKLRVPVDAPWVGLGSVSGLLGSGKGTHVVPSVLLLRLPSAMA